MLEVLVELAFGTDAADFPLVPELLVPPLFPPVPEPLGIWSGYVLVPLILNLKMRFVLEKI